MNIEYEAREILDIICADEDVEAIKLNVSANTTADQFIELCDILRKEGYDSRIEFAKHHSEEDDEIWIYIHEIEE